MPLLLWPQVESPADGPALPEDRISAPKGNPVSTSKSGWIPWAMLLISAALLGCLPIISADIWWHLKAGRMILEQGSVPDTDAFTYTNSGRPWIDLHWGFQILSDVLFRLNGMTALSLGQMGLLSLAVACGWLAAGRTLPASNRALCWILPLLCLTSRVAFRPELMSLVCLAAWLAVLASLDQRTWPLWLLPPLQLLWTNCHGLFILGPIVTAFWLTDRWIRRCGRGKLWQLPVVDQIPGHSLIAVCCLIGLACLANPYGTEGMLFPLTLFRKLSIDRAIYSHVVREFIPTWDWLREGSVWRIDSLALLGTVVWTALSFCLAAWSRHISVFRLLLIVAFGYLAWNMMRNVNLFGLVCGIVATANFDDFRNRSKKAVAPGATPVEGSLALRGCIAVYGILILSVLSNAIYAVGGRPGCIGLGEPAGYFIHQAAMFAGRDGMPRTAFIASFGQASPYLYHNGPARKVFLDGRLEVADVQTFQDYLLVKKLMMQRDRRFEELLLDEDGKLPTVILDQWSAPRLIRALASTPGWRPVFEEPAAVVFLPVQIADQLQLPAIALSSDR